MDSNSVYWVVYFGPLHKPGASWVDLEQQRQHVNAAPLTSQHRPTRGLFSLENEIFPTNMLHHRKKTQKLEGTYH